jgi:hypothetical protein
VKHTKLNRLRKLFFKYLTVDNKSRKDFNLGIFDETEGWVVFTRTDLAMVMEKFDKAIKEYEHETYKIR